METTILSIVKDGGNITANVTFTFSADEFTADEVKAIVQGFQAPSPKATASLSPMQARINKQMGVSDRLFAKYNRD